jgi:hypothetical protein
MAHFSLCAQTMLLVEFLVFFWEFMCSNLLWDSKTCKIKENQIFLVLSTEEAESYDFAWGTKKQALVF